MPPPSEMGRFERVRWYGTEELEPVLPLLAVDATGVGRPVVDMLAAANLPAELVPITITGGTRVTRDGDGYGVPKRDLVAALRLPLDARRLRWAAELPEARTLERELTGFRAKITAALHDSYGHRDGEHDDLLLALARAVWAGEHAVGGVAV